MKIHCVWEHNGNDTLLHAADFPGVATRGESKEIALAKMRGELRAFALWAEMELPFIDEIEITQDAACALNVCDADSDVLFNNEKTPLSAEEYQRLKTLVLRSAADFLALYNSIPDKTRFLAPARKTFYGQAPRTAEETYVHTKNVNAYYFGEIAIEADNDGNILDCRKRGFEKLEKRADFLDNSLFEGSYGELWNLKKVLRRFLWHDRIHAKATYRLAIGIWGKDCIPDPFRF